MRNVLGTIRLAVIAAFACVACASNPPQTAAAARGSCDDDRRHAVDDVEAVVAARRGCSTDADCVSVGVGVGGCFDVCSRSINRVGVEAVRSAETKVSGTWCAAFQKDGCSFFPPPCAPPEPPRCKAGSCA